MVHYAKINQAPHVAAYWKSSNAKACDKKLSQILANNIDNGARNVGLRIYVRLYVCSFYGQLPDY